MSVALATCNGVDWVACQLESILCQTRLPDEIVVRDDASSDGTMAVVRAILRDAPSSVVVDIAGNEQRLGVIKNFESALRACTGDVVVLCDQDDIWRVDKLRVLERRFLGHGVMGVFSDARLIDAEGRSGGRGSLWAAVGFNAKSWSSSTDPLAALLRGNVVTGATLAVASAVVQRAVPLPSGEFHDHWLAMVAASCGLLLPEEEHLIDYRQHDANVAGLAGLTPLGRVRAAAGLAGRASSKAEMVRLLRHRAAPVPAPQERLLDDVEAFLLERAALPSRRVRRLPHIARLWRAGRYTTFCLRPLAAAGADLLITDRRRTSPRAGAARWS